MLQEAYRHATAVENGERKVVGENIFASAEEPQPTRLYQHNPAALTEQLDRLNEVRTRRSEGAVRRAVERLRDAAAAEENVMPHTLECVRAYATVGEVMGALREVFGTYREPVGIFE